MSSQASPSWPTNKGTDEPPDPPRIISRDRIKKAHSIEARRQRDRVASGPSNIRSRSSSTSSTSSYSTVLSYTTARGFPSQDFEEKYNQVPLFSTSREQSIASEAHGESSTVFFSGTTSYSSPLNVNKQNTVPPASSASRTAFSEPPARISRFGGTCPSFNPTNMGTEDPDKPLPSIERDAPHSSTDSKNGMVSLRSTSRDPGTSSYTSIFERLKFGSETPVQFTPSSTPSRSSSTVPDFSNPFRESAEKVRSATAMPTFPTYTRPQTQQSVNFGSNPTPAFISKAAVPHNGFGTQTPTRSSLEPSSRSSYGSPSPIDKATSPATVSQQSCGARNNTVFAFRGPSSFASAVPQSESNESLQQERESSIKPTIFSFKGSRLFEVPSIPKNPPEPRSFSAAPALPERSDAAISASSTEATRSTPRAKSAVVSPKPTVNTISDVANPRAKPASPAPDPIYRLEHDEKLPSYPFYTDAVQQSLGDTRTVVSRIADALEFSAVKQGESLDVQRLRNKALGLSKFHPPSSRIVGLVGSSGVGKSSLINSLLDKVSMAKVSGMGAACTCVATEYHYHDIDEFHVEVEYFTKEELRTYFQELLVVHAIHLLPPADREVDDGDDFKKKAEAASKTLKTMFGNRMDQNPDVLKSETAIEDLVNWSVEILSCQKDNAANQLVQKFKDEDEKSFSETLSKLTTQISNTRGENRWPFVRKLKVHLKAHILSKGLVLTDLPGLRDLNPVRQSVTERYIRDCDQIFAVEEITRITTNQGISEVFALARNASLSNIGIVCTKSEDNINADEFKPSSTTEEGHISGLQKDIDSVKSGIKENREQLHGTAISSSATENTELKLYQDIFKNEKLLEELNFRLRKHIMLRRNIEVTSELQKRYVDENTGLKPPVFCISNTMYQEKRRLTAQESKESIQLSGVPALRRHCIALVASSHLRTTREYIENEVPALINSVELWLQSGSGIASVEEKKIATVVDAVQKHVEELKSSESSFSQLADSLEERFRPISSCMKTNTQNWSTAAQDAGKHWATICHHSTYLACCRNSGKFNSQNWNRDAFKQPENDLTCLWDNLEQEIQKEFDDIKNKVTSLFKEMTEKVPKQQQSDSKTQEKFRTLDHTLYHRRKLVGGAIGDLFYDSLAELYDLRRSALAPISTSIFSILMEQVYVRCRSETSKGSDSKRKAIIAEFLSKKQLFVDYSKKVEDGFNAVADNARQRAVEAVNEQMELLQQDLDMMKSEYNILESEKNLETRQRVTKEVEKAKKKMQKLSERVDKAVKGGV